MINTMKLFKVQGKRGSCLRLVIASAGLTMLVACASVPQPPTAQLQAAESAITDAEKARAAEFAAAELAEARDKLRAANSAVQKEEMVQALRFAEQSRVDAELASARAEAARAGIVNDDMRKSIVMLKQEMQRNTGETQ
jgi:hypothetical protein